MDNYTIRCIPSPECTVKNMVMEETVDSYKLSFGVEDANGKHWHFKFAGPRKHLSIREITPVLWHVDHVECPPENGEEVG